MRLLLVEDDNMIAEAMVNSLKDAGFAVDHVLDGNSALHTLSCQTYDTVLLDLGLPKLDGFSVLTSLRKSSNIPVIIITARDNLNERVRGLDLGADDYILKPFDIAELQARLRAVLRRSGGEAQPIISIGDLQLNPLTHEVSILGSDWMILTLKEFMLLRALMSVPGIILSKNELEDKIYPWGEEVESNAVEYLIYALRKKIGKERIKNVRGIGWMVPKKK